MKKLAVIFLTLLVGVIIGYFIPKMHADSSKTIPGPEVKALLDVCNEPDHNITVAEAQNLTDTFIEREEDHDPTDFSTRSVWFSLCELETLVTTLEDEQASQNTNGIRFYFARYPDVSVTGAAYPNRQRNTLVLVSTKDTVLYIGKPDSLHITKDYFIHSKSQSKSAFFSTANAFAFADPINKGELCPNNCQGATLACPDPTSTKCDGQ